jgi:ferredoxin
VIFLLSLMRAVTGRIRIDQVVSFAWKYLAPLAVLQLLIVIFINQCVDSCPTDAMLMDQKFEIAAFDRHDLKMAWEFVRAVVKIKPQA